MTLTARRHVRRGPGEVRRAANFTGCRVLVAQCAAYRWRPDEAARGTGGCSPTAGPRTAPPLIPPPLLLPRCFWSAGPSRLTGHFYSTQAYAQCPIEMKNIFQTRSLLSAADLYSSCSCPGPAGRFCPAASWCHRGRHLRLYDPLLSLPVPLSSVPVAGFCHFAATPDGNRFCN